MFLDVIFPPRCVGCDKVLSSHDKFICVKCKEHIRYVEEPRCLKCSKQLNDYEQEYCYDCKRKVHKYDKGFALYQYSSIYESIYRFKYQNRQEYVKFYAYDINKRLRDVIMGWKPDALIPVPLHKKKMKARGYNQSEILAKELSSYLNIPVLSNYVLRQKETRAQKELNDLERENNLKKAFIIPQNDVKLGTVVIIDDIYTTGSTINAIADEMHIAGVQKIYFVTLAIGKGL